MYYIKKIFLTFLLKIKNFLAKFKKKQKVDTGFVSENKKSVINQAASLEIKNKTDELKNEVERISEKIVKKYFGDIDKTIQILESKKIRVYRTRFVVDILKNINEKQGFILPLKGFKAFYLNFIISLLCDKKLVFKSTTDSMFIFHTKPIDKFFLASQVYRFVAFRKKMPGFEYDVQEKFKKIYKSPKASDFNMLTAGEIFALKEAIARDVESVDFAVKLNQETKITN